VSEFLTTERKRNGDQFSSGPRPVESPDSAIALMVSGYPQWVHDVEKDEVVPFDTARLIEATRLLDVLSLAGPPGCPTDVPPALQPVVQYQVAATFSRHGRHPVDPKSAMSIPYIMDMAQALGHPLESLPIYVFTPLTLGSESLACALKFKNRLRSVSVSDMASLGCVTPIHPGDAFALCGAEVVGAAILLREMIDLPIHWGIRLCPIDLRNMAMSLGSPEDLLLQFGNAELNAFLHGTRWWPASGNVHTSAKLPSAQSCTEKASLMTAGALLGARRFGDAGSLSLDEVFSAEQLMYDLEIRDHVQRLVSGMDADCGPERCLKDVLEGVEQKTFAGLETTLGLHRDIYWHPKLFHRQFFSAWQSGGAQTLRESARQRMSDLLRQHEYELEGGLRRQLDRIVDRAKADLGD
jgi:trimethylamine:corrinoid methyltransferase-like protein